MSEFREDLLVSTINKKRIVKIILIAVLLVTSFAFSILLFSLLWGTQRPLPSDQLSEAEYEPAIPTKIPLPFDFSDLFDLFSNLNLTEEQLNDIIVSLQDFLDADIEDLDLNDFASLLLALMFSDVEVFRVYDYYDFNSMTNKLWKYECYDEFIGDGWRSSSTRKIQDFYSYSDYGSKYGYLDMLTIQMPLSPALGMNSLNIPTLFPTPFIMDGSVNAPNLIPGSPVLNIGSFNCTSLDLTFESTDDVNMTYEMFGLDLPSDDMINNSAVIVTNPSSHYLEILSNFTQLPTDRNTYINQNPFFKAHYNNLFNIINYQDNDFTIANKIRNYFFTYFTFGTTARNNDPPGDTEDIVYWFSEHQEGLWSDIASAFSIFCRVFNVASRFVNGFNSEGIEEILGENSFAIKYRNMYSWVEIYVPTDIYGNGNWVQMDIPLPIGGVSEYSITVNSNFTVGPRGEVANITATLISDILPVDNRRIDFYDVTMEQPIGIAYSDINGKASILIDIDDSQVVGPHVITASYQTLNNYTFYSVIGDIQVNLNNVNPMEVNRSIDPTTNVQGNVYDPIANQYVKYAELKLLLLEKGTNTEISFNPFNPTYIMTDNYGDFNDFVDVDPSVPFGEYDLRVDFNGTWFHPLIPFPLYLSNINDSSNRLDFSVTEELTFNLLFYINNTLTNYPGPINPSNLVYAKRGDSLNLSVFVRSQIDGSPLSGELIEFYDYTDNNFLGSDNTDSNGYASILIPNIQNSKKPGPQLLYAQLGSKYNYSYYIVNETVDFEIISGPDPREIDRLNGNFDLYCRLIDPFNNVPIDNSEIFLKMFRGGIDYSYLLNPNNPSFFETTGIFNINNMRVQSYTAAGNYTLRLDFDGDFHLMNNPYPQNFFISDLSTSESLLNQLKVIDPENVNISLAVEWQPTVPFYDDLYQPQRYEYGEEIQIQVQVFHTMSLEGNFVRLYDDFKDILLREYDFTGSETPYGFVQFNISSNELHAGLIKFRVQYHTYSTINTSYVIINETVNIFANSNKKSVLRGDTSFTVSGIVQESGELLKGLIVNIRLLDSTHSDVSVLYLNGPQTDNTGNSGSFEFTNSINQNCPQGKYYIRIDFNGSIFYPESTPAVLLTDYLIHNSSLLIQLNITAGVEIIQDGYHTTPHDISEGEWWVGDILYVYGNLTWDNGTAIANMMLNVTIQLLSGQIISFDTIFTDQFGGFNASMLIDGSWPDLVSDSKIIVYFEPADNNLNYVEKAEKQFT